MILLKNSEDLLLMRKAGEITAGALNTARELIKPGQSLISIDKAIRKYIEKNGAKPSFLGYNGFPASACISINEEVIHGIPSERQLQEGDIVKVDVGAFYNGYHGDAARTFFCGDVSEEAKRLEEITRQSFFEGIKYADSQYRIGDISNAVQRFAEDAGYSVVREYVGHGVGKNLHEEPEVPNFGKAGKGPRIYEGMTLAIEPMINEGTYEVDVLDNDWTVVTLDGKLSAHYENTVAIGPNGAEILTSTD